MRYLVGASIIALFAGCAGDDSSSPASTVVSVTTIDTTTSVPAATTTETATSTTSSTTTSTTTTLAPTGSREGCDGFLTLDDPDADGHGECVVTMEDAREQYYVISGKINVVAIELGNSISASECPTWLAASQTFIDDLRAATWPAEVQPQLDELIAASEFDIFAMDESCSYGTQARLDEASSRRNNAVFEWRSAIGSPTDI